MGKISFSGLRARVLLLVVLAITPWLLTTVYHAVEEQRLAISKEQEDALQLTRLISFNQQEIITHSYALLQALSILPAIRGGSPADCRLSFASMLIDSQKYANMGVTDARGALLCDSLATSKPLWFGDRAWFQQTLKTRHFVVSSLLVGRASGKPIVIAAVPIFDAQGGIIRVIFHCCPVKRVIKSL